MTAPAPSTNDWIPRAKVALAGLRDSDALLARVHADVNAFFKAHPEEPRDAANEKLITFLILDRLTGEESQPPTEGAK